MVTQLGEDQQFHQQKQDPQLCVLSPPAAQESSHGASFAGRGGQLPVLMIHKLQHSMHTVLYLALFHLIMYPRTLYKSLPTDFILLYISYGFTTIYLVVLYLCCIPYFARKKKAAVNSVYMCHFTRV